MILVETEGRLGNQMFQVAFAYATMRRLGATVRFRSGLDPILTGGFELEGWRPRAPRGVDLAFRLRHPRPRFVGIDGRDDDPDAVVAGVRDGTRMRGFFQSQRYFSGYEDEIGDLFTVRRRFRDAFAERFGHLERYVAIHVRRGDYLGTPWALPPGYYRAALEAVAIPGLPTVVVSDDPDAARALLRGVRDLRFESNAPIIDLQLLVHADALVLSASSFSWWGAWLNRRPGLVVAAPRHWLGFARGVEEPRAVIPEGWRQISVVSD